MGVPLSSQQEIDPNRLFVRVQTQLQPQPSPPRRSAAHPAPGTLVTAYRHAAEWRICPRSHRMTVVRGGCWRRRFGPSPCWRRNNSSKRLGGLKACSRWTGPEVCPKALAAQCSPFPSCPTGGCAIDSDHKLTNTRKRLFPKATPIKILTFDELDLLQALTDAKGIPQGEHLTAAQRKQLTNFQIGGLTISEGDHIAVTGFIAEDRTIRCGGAESVNCGHSEPAGGEPACTRTDIHVPIVERVNGHEVQSIVSEPIPQGPNVKAWTPSAFREVKKQGRRLLIQGGLFYDSGHIVNTDENSTSASRSGSPSGRFIRLPPCWCASGRITSAIPKRRQIGTRRSSSPDHRSS